MSAAAYAFYAAIDHGIREAGLWDTLDHSETPVAILGAGKDARIEYRLLAGTCAGYDRLEICPSDEELPQWRARLNGPSGPHPDPNEEREHKELAEALAPLTSRVTPGENADAT